MVVQSTSSIEICSARERFIILSIRGSCKKNLKQKSRENHCPDTAWGKLRDCDSAESRGTQFKVNLQRKCKESTQKLEGKHRL